MLQWPNTHSQKTVMHIIDAKEILCNIISFLTILYFSSNTNIPKNSMEKKNKKNTIVNVLIVVLFLVRPKE